MMKQLGIGSAKRGFVFTCLGESFFSGQPLTILPMVSALWGWLRASSFQASCKSARRAGGKLREKHTPLMFLVPFDVSIKSWVHSQWLVQLNVPSCIWWHFLVQPTNSINFITFHIRNRKLEKQNCKEGFTLKILMTTTWWFFSRSGIFFPLERK